MVRAQTIAGGLLAVAHAEDIIKDLVGEWAVIAGLLQHGHELVHLQLTLTGEAAIVTAPRQMIHGEAGSIGGLDEKDAIPRDSPNGTQLRLTRKDMECIQYQADIGVCSTAHYFPAIAVVVNMATPGQCFIRDTQVTPSGTLTQFMEIIGKAAQPRQRIGVNS